MDKKIPRLGIKNILIALAISFLAGAVTFTFVGDNSNNKKVDTNKVKIIDAAARKTVPSLQSKTYSGDKLEFDPNRITVLNFWASWCGPCIEETPLLVEISNDFPDVQFIGLTNDDSEAKALAFAKKYKIDYQIGNGDEYLSKLQPIQPIYGLPTTLIIDREGRIAAKVIGGITDKEFRTALSKLSAE